MRWFVLAAAVLALPGCGSKTAQVQPTTVERPPVRITQFYAEAVVPKGEKTSLCYGVENAKSVRLDPPVERVWPAVARCFPVDPARASTYTLTAEDDQGHTVSQKVEMRIGPARPRIIEVSVNKTSIHRGEEVVVCYKAVNALSVDAGPGHWATTRSNEHACISDRPSKSTTYHVKITGGGGQTDSERVTVAVR